MPDAWSIRLALVSFGCLVVRIASATVVMQPGYTDAMGNVGGVSSPRYEESDNVNNH